MVQTECGLCNKVMFIQTLRSHTKKYHELSISEYKEKFRFVFSPFLQSLTVCFQCQVCGESFPQLRPVWRIVTPWQVSERAHAEQPHLAPCVTWCSATRWRPTCTPTRPTPTGSTTSSSWPGITNKFPKTPTWHLNPGMLPTGTSRGGRRLRRSPRPWRPPRRPHPSMPPRPRPSAPPQPCRPPGSGSATRSSTWSPGPTAVPWRRPGRPGGQRAS